MNLLLGEKILLESESKTLVVTTHRVRLEMETASFSKMTSIMLDEISTCEITATSKPWLLGAAVVVFLIGLFASMSNNPFSRTDSTGVIGGVVIGLLFVLAYFGTREKVISLRSSSGAINIATRGMSKENATAFINTVEAAKDDRYFAAGKATAASA